MIKTRLKSFLALLLLVSLVMPVVADKIFYPTVADRVDDLILDLKYGQSGVRLRAVMALGEIGDARAVDLLVEVLKNKDEGLMVRQHAAEALGKIGDPKAVDPLIETLKEDASDFPFIFRTEDRGLVQADSNTFFVEKQANTARALGEIGDPRAILPLIEVLKDESPKVRLWAAYSLVKLGQAEYFDQVVLALENERFGVRDVATEALGEIGDPRAVGPLSEALSDENAWVRRHAAEALGKIGDNRAVEPLTYLALNDEDSRVRYAAASALKKLEV